MVPVFNNNGGAGIPIGTGNFCAILAPFPGVQQQGSGQNQCPMLLNISYTIQSPGTSTGLLTFQELGADGNWRGLVSPGQITLTATVNYQGSFVGPYHGIRINAASIAVAPITYAELKGTGVSA